MPTATLSIRVDERAKDRLARLSESTGRTSSFLAAEAIDAYLDVQEWQVAGIRAAMTSLDAGEGIAHDRIREWVESWDGPDEKLPPDQMP